MEELTVIVIDDDGLEARHRVFVDFFTKEARHLGRVLDIWFLTEFPKSLCLLQDADVVCWDSDLGNDSECVRHLRRMQFTGEPMDVLTTIGTHIVHSMNEPAAERLVQLLRHDPSLPTRRIPFHFMKEHCHG